VIVSGMVQVGSVRVLVVDDSVAVRDRLVALLSELAGVDVVGTASDAPEGVAVARRLAPDAVVLDIRMPGGDGVAVLQDIKARAPETVVVMLTNYTDEEHRARCLAAGADHFLDKSVDLDRLAEIFEGLASAARPGGEDAPS
jgi:DNA-binding NarL/FixJ family response regulator